MKHVIAGDLEIAYKEFGPQDGQTAILLHGFPYDVRSYCEVTARLAQNGIRSIVPYLRGYGPTRFISDDTPRSGEQAALGSDLLALMDALSISEAVIGGYDWGGRAACIVAALWPDRVKGLVSCGVGYNIQDIGSAGNPVAPEEEARYWYVYYFQTERGRTALETNRKELCRFIWKLWSPNWTFDDRAYDETATSFENPDFVEIVIHSYRHRLGGAPGDPRLAGIEQRLAAKPHISVPAIVLQGADDGVDPPEKDDLACGYFIGEYERKIISGTGHNPPQESPGEFANAIQSLFGIK
jgi:pimeloyl-ACP methyl ester carboxylesterase